MLICIVFCEMAPEKGARQKENASEFWTAEMRTTKTIMMCKHDCDTIHQLIMLFYKLIGCDLHAIFGKLGQLQKVR